MVIDELEDTLSNSDNIVIETKNGTSGGSG